ncbi:MAG: sigma-70 family RNA polymerase sigma factor [Bacillota bacterium]|nr:sigma-70 family RNA polymerase sigma factor [Bacillota bacterium]
MEGIKELYETYERRIFRYLYGLTLDFYKAEELTQETFFQVLKSFYRFRGDCHVSTWIYKIARNVFREYSRKNKITAISIDDNLSEIMDDDGPEEAFERKESSRLVKSVLMKIPEKQREVLWLREWQELSYEEIAGITEHTVSWVKVNIHRGRLEFKKFYYEGGDADEQISL